MCAWHGPRLKRAVSKRFPRGGGGGKQFKDEANSQSIIVIIDDHLVFRPISRYSFRRSCPPFFLVRGSSGARYPSIYLRCALLSPGRNGVRTEIVIDSPASPLKPNLASLRDRSSGGQHPVSTARHDLFHGISTTTHLLHNPHSLSFALITCPISRILDRLGRRPRSMHHHNPICPSPPPCDVPDPTHTQ